MDAILDFSLPLNVSLLDQAVNAFYFGRGAEQTNAQRLITQFQEHPDAWLRVDAILESSSNLHTRYLALQIMDKLISTRWNALPREQCEAIKNYVVSLIIKTAGNATGQERTFLNKLNLVLVQILKHEWPKHWPSFISEIVGASKSSIALCENNMIILRLLSEEVFDFSSEQMTTVKAKNLKTQLCGEFSQVFQLCSEILEKASKPSLLLATLEALLRFLRWIPLGYIFETALIDILVTKFLPTMNFRTATLACLTEIGALEIGSEYDNKFARLFAGIMEALIGGLLPYNNELDLNQVYQNSSDAEQRFLQNLALCLSSCLGNHLTAIEVTANREHLLLAHYYLLKLSLIEDREVFKVCLEYWNRLVTGLFNENPVSLFQILEPVKPTRAAVYTDILSNLRIVLIDRMVKPEEVLVVEDENGEIVRESVKETDTIVLYKSMREVLVFLTNLDVVDTENVMTEKLSRQVDGSEWSWGGLNRLCWSIGSISGTMSEESEKRFLVHVIRELLGLVEIKRGKDNKAVVASNIMYVVGQYPRFLKAHWKFMKTVVNKLFEFMHESHEGVQDMACDTFIKIAKKCRRQFVMVQPGETQPFIDDILGRMGSIVCDLSPQQVHVFYEAIGCTIESHPVVGEAHAWISALMFMPNQSWDAIIAAAVSNSQFLHDTDTLRSLVNILKTNSAALSSIGYPFVITQVARIFMDMLSLYRNVSESISSAVQSQGILATKTPVVRAMRSVKKEVLRLMTLAASSVKENDPAEEFCNTYVSYLFEAILLDYKQNVPQAREPEVLSLTSKIVDTFKEPLVGKYISPILDAVFEPTLNMINKDFAEFPEHRIAFFSLLQAICTSCFASLLRLPSNLFKLYVDSIVWAFKHTHREVADTGLSICLSLLENMSKSDSNLANAFYSSFYLAILQDIFFVLTDSDHQSGFKFHALILAHLFRLTSSKAIKGPLFGNNESNAAGIERHIKNMISTAFPHLNTIQTDTFVRGLFDLNSASQDTFKAHLRDFLISLKEFSEADNSELYREERELEQERKRQAEMDAARRVPGLIKPSERTDDFSD